METINEIIACSSESLRGHMKFEEYKQYLITAIFYKYLSYKIEKENNKKLFKFNINFQEAFDEENKDFYGNKIKKESVEELGFFIEPKNLYNNIIKGENILLKFDDAFQEIKFQDETFNNLFDKVKFGNIDLIKETKEIFEEILINIDSLTFKKTLNDEFNDLMKFFMKKSYTPNEISLLLSRLVLQKDKELENVYDAACGSCSTLLRLKDNHVVNNYYGQELNKHTFNMARMNMIMHDILPKNIHIYNEDSTISQRKLPLMDAIISHPPFLKKWDACEELLEEKRFNSYKKLPPKSKADFAFIETMIYQLKDDGIMAVAIPQGVLFRTNAEKEIRKNFILNNYIDAIIGLPEKIFSKNIPTCIIVFKKNRTEDDKILFIDASQKYEKGFSLNILREIDIDNIVETYRNSTNIDKYSYCASIEEIIENDYNLNIKLYINTYPQKEKISIPHVIEEIDDIDNKIIELNNKENYLINKIINS